MDWQKGRESDNVVEDAGGGDASGGRGFGFGGIHLGVGGIIAVVVVSVLLGKNPLDMLAFVTGGVPPAVEPAAPRASAARPADDSDIQVRFVKSILGSTEDVWGSYFQSHGQAYERPRLDLFRGRVNTACGAASAAMGPFYCPGDRLVYLDLEFFQEMDTRFHARGDFARAYVIAHEVGHHVQNLIGVMDQVDTARRRGQPMEGAAGLSVRLELQADCFAGVWAKRSQAQLNWLGPGDVEAALNAAAQVGDDTLQRQARGTVVPDSFTHGTSAQRASWFKAGLAAGEIGACNTFQARAL
jgi:predicted metalloprotease